MKYIMSKKTQINWAARYEAAWHECFWKMSEFAQVQVIQEPAGDYSDRLAKECRILAEKKEWKPKKDYRNIPTGIADLKEINNTPF